MLRRRCCNGMPADPRFRLIAAAGAISYKDRMNKQAISVTLAADNLLWLRGQAHAAGARSISAVLDRLISAARTGGHVYESAARSVVGTVHISDSDPELRGADAAVRALFPAPCVAADAARYSRPKRRPTGRRRRHGGR